jgi:hypothetical protein
MEKGDIVIIDEAISAKEFYETQIKPLNDKMKAITKTILIAELGEEGYEQHQKKEALDQLRGNHGDFYDHFSELKYRIVKGEDDSLSVIGTNEGLKNEYRNEQNGLYETTRVWKKGEWPKEAEVWDNHVWFDQDEHCLVFETIQDAGEFKKQLDELGILATCRFRLFDHW